MELLITPTESFLENDLVVRNKGIGLEKNLPKLRENLSVKTNKALSETPTGRFFRTSSLISRASPTTWERFCEFCVKFLRVLLTGGALANLEFYQEFFR